jgi:hypothetical protein
MLKNPKIYKPELSLTDMKRGRYEIFTFSSQARKRGQIKMSFGMIFSIILIIFFVAFAFIVIKNFIGLQSSVTTKQFSDNLQKDVNVVWNSAQATQQKSYNMPSSVKEVCFTNDPTGDVVIYDDKGYANPGGNIENLNLTAMTPRGDLCFNVVDGKINLVLKKDFGENLVTISK